MDRDDVKPRVRPGQNPRPHLFILSLAFGRVGPGNFTPSLSQIRT